MRLKLQTRYIIAVIFLFFSSGVTYADMEDSRLKETCERQAQRVTAEFKNDKGYSDRDLHMIRLGAVNDCMKALQNKGKPPSGATEPAPADNKKARRKDSDTRAKSEKKETFLERLFSTKPKKAVNPMQKQHRTGGK